MKQLIPLFVIIAGLALAGCNRADNNPPSGNTTTPGGMTTNSMSSTPAGTNAAPAQ